MLPAHKSSHLPNERRPWRHGAGADRATETAREPKCSRWPVSDRWFIDLANDCPLVSGDIRGAFDRPRRASAVVPPKFYYIILKAAGGFTVPILEQCCRCSPVTVEAGKRGEIAKGWWEQRTKVIDDFRREGDPGKSLHWDV